MSRSKPPFNADVVGSLLRPQYVLKARAQRDRGEIATEALWEIETRAVDEAVAMQKAVGLKVCTDGEFHRRHWFLDFLEKVDGVKTSGGLPTKFHNEKGDLEFTPAGVHVVGKLKFEKCIFGDHFTFLKSVVTKGTPKLTIPSPSMMHYRGGRAAIDPAIYPKMDAFWHDLAAVYADEIEALGKLGCTYLQLDDTSLAYLNDPTQREYVTKIGGDGESQHLTYIKLINASLAKKPAGMTVCTHMCRGNFRSSWAASGGYDHVADALFNQLNVDGFFLEYDDARSGSFEPLRFVPKGKIVVLGLVTTKRAALEKKDELKRRIEEASKYVPLDQICLSPQCGFSSTVEGNALTIDEEIAKLNLVVEVAREVWG